MQKIHEIIALLDEKKAQNIAHIALLGKDYITNNVIIATAMAGKHGHFLLDEAKKLAKNLGLSVLAEDAESESWLIVDFGDVILHIFSEERRKIIKLEDFLAEFSKKPEIL